MRPQRERRSARSVGVRRLGERVQKVGCRPLREKGAEWRVRHPAASGVLAHGLSRGGTIPHGLATPRPPSNLVVGRAPDPLHPSLLPRHVGAQSGPARARPAAGPHFGLGVREHAPHGGARGARAPRRAAQSDRRAGRHTPVGRRTQLRPHKRARVEQDERGEQAARDGRAAPRLGVGRAEAMAWRGGEGASRATGRPAQGGSEKRVLAANCQRRRHRHTLARILSIRPPPRRWSTRADGPRATAAATGARRGGTA